MSRSHRKPWVKDKIINDTGITKRLASKKVRRYKQGISNGKWYKKIFDSYELVEYRDWYDTIETRRK